MRVSKRWPTRWHHCRCGWEVWGCDRLRAWRLRHIGRHGRTSCSGRPVEAQLAEEGAPRVSVGELKECTRILDHAGFVGRPSWAELRGGRRPRASFDNEPESGTTAGSTMLLPLPNTTFGRAWCEASRVPQTRLICVPMLAQVRATCCRVHLLVRKLFRTLVLERLRLPLEVVESQCECGTLLDTLGRHRAACPIRQIEDKSRPPRENQWHASAGRQEPQCGSTRVCAR